MPTRSGGTVEIEQGPAGCGDRLPGEEPSDAVRHQRHRDRKAGPCCCRPPPRPPGPYSSSPRGSGRSRPRASVDAWRACSRARAASSGTRSGNSSPRAGEKEPCHNEDVLPAGARPPPRGAQGDRPERQLPEARCANAPGALSVERRFRACVRNVFAVRTSAPAATFSGGSVSTRSGVFVSSAPASRAAAPHRRRAGRAPSPSPHREGAAPARKAVAECVRHGVLPRPE